MRYELGELKRQTDIVVGQAMNVLLTNDRRIETAVRTLLAEPGNPHAGASAALSDLDDDSELRAAAAAGLAELATF